MKWLDTLISFGKKKTRTVNNSLQLLFSYFISNFYFCTCGFLRIFSIAVGGLLNWPEQIKVAIFLLSIKESCHKWPSKGLVICKLYFKSSLISVKKNAIFQVMFIQFDLVRESWSHDLHQNIIRINFGESFFEVNRTAGN